MEVVLLVLGIIGIALVAVPRIQRRSRGGRRVARSRRGPVAKRRRTAAAAAAPAVATWTPAPGADEDGWDDDLGWEGVDTAAPEAREAWERWRVTDSPLASEDPEDAPVEPVAELPSVERWRTKAQEEEDWLDEDDGLGWEGEHAAPTLWNGNGDAPARNGNGQHVAPARDELPAPAPATAPARDGLPASAPAGNEHHPAPARDDLPAPAPAGNGHHPAPARDDLPAPGDWTSGRDWTRKPQPEPAVASASAATDVAPEPELGRTSALEDDGWDDEPVGRPWGAPAEDVPPAKPSSPAARDKRKLHPVLLLAIYAAAGITLVVLISTALLGGSTDKAPADARATPAPVRTPEPTPEATGTAADDPAALEEARAAEATARREFRRERTRALGARGEAVDRARAAARRKARAAERAQERRRESRITGNGAPPPDSVQPPTPTPPAGGNPAPVPAPRRSAPVCEFCIG